MLLNARPTRKGWGGYERKDSKERMSGKDDKEIMARIGRKGQQGKDAL